MLETTEIQDKAGRVIATVTTCDHEGDTVPVITAAVERLAELLVQEWADYREGPDYHPTDRHAVQDTWNAGKRAALFSLQGGLAVALFR